MSLRWDDAARTLDLGVHDLLEAGERDLRALAMSSRARLAAGVAVHREVQEAAAAADARFQAEVRLKHVVVVREWVCTVHGRVDGLSEEDGRTVLEEIKSSALPSDQLDAVPGFPAWERQLAWYVHFAVAARMADPIGRLRVVSLLDGAQRLVLVRPDPALEAELHARLDGWVLERERRIAWRARRRHEPTVFAHDEARPGQDAIVAAVEAAVAESRHLLLSAPTGIGKTAAVLHGALRAAAARDLRVFWATARTTQQEMVERTLRDMAARGTPVRSATLRAKEKACLNGVVDCRPEVCAYAAGYRERVQEPDATGLTALERLAEVARPTADDVATLGRERTLCPYALAADWAEAADVVIGDYNYAFDPDVRGYADGKEWVVVVEEAHQLPDRAQGWGSPALPRALVDAALVALPEEGGWAALRALAREIGDALEDAALLSVGEVDGTSIVEAHPRRWADLRDRVDEVALDHALLRAALPPDAPDPWLDLARGVARFADALQRASEETLALWTPEGLRLVCRDPSRLLGPVFGAARASVAVSATLHPTWFWRERCGLHPDRVDTLDVEPPFPPENRRVVVVPGISTAYKHRSRDKERIADALERTVAAVPGNAAVFFGSFEQMGELTAEVTWDGRERVMQTPAMAEADRARLLQRMREPGPPRVLCAVLGGVFAEGIDLPGDALSAAIVVGPALPPPGAERSLLQAWYEDRFDQGFELAYVQPGMTRVVQAAGRVVRGPEDRGLVVLLCQRFLRHEFAAYLPSHWDVTRSSKPWEVAGGFFGRG